MPARSLDVIFRDGVLVLGRRAYDQTQVSAWRSSSSARLHLSLTTGTHVREKILVLDSPSQSEELHRAIMHWLSDGDDEESDTGEQMLSWEIARVEEEERLRVTLAVTLGLLFRRMLRDPVQFAIFLLACTCLGLGMVRDVWDVVYARQDGTWYDANCIIEHQHFDAEPLHTVNLKGNTGVLWKVTGTYAVHVRFEDGCDDGLWQLSNNIPFEDLPEVRFFESYDISDSEQAVEDLSMLDPELDWSAFLVKHGPEPPPTLPDLDVFLNGSETNPCPDDHDLNLDPLRGEHVAYRRLVLDHDDFCWGPQGSNRTTALLHCRNTQAIWLHRHQRIGSSMACFVFARLLDDGNVEAHVVTHKDLPWDIRMYLGYWMLLFTGVAWLLLLVGVKLLRRLGMLEAPEFLEDEFITAESTDMLSLSGGVGQPGSALAASVEQMYAYSSRDVLQSDREATPQPSASEETYAHRPLPSLREKPIFLPLL
mmetsp:Transcript_26175/g.64642  ORF Transcript_26175/g.64642 Transcript_26175/m.64642 type:complete len:480 (+) Transcript_26175:3-1442(+)